MRVQACFSGQLLLFGFGMMLAISDTHAQPVERMSALIADNPVAATPAAARLAGTAQRKRLEASSPLGNVPFTSIGPRVMSGRVADVEGKPGDPATFIVAYASGGLWRTVSNGSAFTPLFDEEASMTIGDIAVDWHDPEGDGETIWVGTGESNSSRSSYAGTGVYVSTDGGATWAHRGLAETHHVGRVVLHPDDPETLWVAAVGHLYSPNPERGIYRSTDGGRTWAKTLYVDDNTGGIDLVMDPSTPDVLYAATWTRARRAWDFAEAGAGSGIWKSTNGGVTWERLTVEGSGFPVGETVGRIGLDVYPGDPQVLYATVDNQARRPKDDVEKEDEPVLTGDQLMTMDREAFLQLTEKVINGYLDANNFPYSYTAESVLEMVRKGKIEPRALVEYLEDANRTLFETPVIGAEVYRSDDRGETWTKTHEDYLDNFVYSYGYYFGQVRVAPDDPDRLYLLGVPLIGSTDGGATWEAVDEAHVHVDHHALWIDPQDPDHLISGNDGGVNVSFDDAASWSKANTPAVGQFYTVQYDMEEPYNVYGGLQDNGVWVGPHDYEASPGWRAEGDYAYKRLMGGDGMQVSVDSRDNDTVVTGFQFGNTFRLSRTGKGQAVHITPEHELGEQPLRFNWQTPHTISRHVPDVLYLGSNKLHVSYDQGATWSMSSEDLTGEATSYGWAGDVPFSTLTTVSESPVEFGLLVVGTDDGHIHVSEDGGKTWREASVGLPEALWVSRVELSHHKRSRLYAALNGYRWDHFDAYVYRSDDLGRTWTRIGMDLPAEPVNVVREDPVIPEVVYVGTDHGVYVSLDGGNAFTAMRGQFTGESSMPNVPVHDLVIHPREKHLLVGTHGRSLWRADVSLVQQVPSIRSAGIHLFTPDTTQYSKRWGTRDYAWGDTPEPELTIAYWSMEAGEVTLTVADSSGVERTRLFDTAEVGLNFTTYALTSETALADGQQPGENSGVYYLTPGRYTLTITRREATATAPLVVAPGPEPRSRARKKMP